MRVVWNSYSEKFYVYNDLTGIQVGPFESDWEAAEYIESKQKKEREKCTEQ